MMENENSVQIKSAQGNTIKKLMEDSAKSMSGCNLKVKKDIKTSSEHVNEIAGNAAEKGQKLMEQLSNCTKKNGNANVC